jgi:cobyrinic acid a,c-diamide synthase
MGMIMEDHAEIALIWDDAFQMSLGERLERLSEAGTSIVSLAEAAEVVIRHGEA